MTPSPPEPASTGSSPIALVTGGHSGIGLYASIHLALKGFHVLIASRTASKVSDAIIEAERDHPELTGTGKLTYVKLDLTDLDSVRKCVKEVESSYGRLDVLSAYPPVIQVEENDRRGVCLHGGLT